MFLGSGMSRAKVVGDSSFWWEVVVAPGIGGLCPGGHRELGGFRAAQREFMMRFMCGARAFWSGCARAWLRGVGADAGDSDPGLEGGGCSRCS